MKLFRCWVVAAIMMKFLVMVFSRPQSLDPNPNDQTNTHVGGFQSDWPVGDPRRCVEQSRLSKMYANRFEALPGVGWDNLRNLEGGLVVTHNFTQCKLTDDGHFLIPDNVFTIPIKNSRVERFAEIIDRWHSSSSLTSLSINVEAGMQFTQGSISGKFSYEHEELKSKQIEDKAVTIRVQLRYNRYEAKLQPDPVLSPEFKSRLLSIASNIQLNQTKQARYEGQLLVRDFGTHVITGVTAGAALVKEDYLKAQFLSENHESKSSILASVSASFHEIFHLTASTGTKSNVNEANSYNNSLTYSVIKTIGGPLFRPEHMQTDVWSNGVDRNLVPLDRTGDPLYYLVTKQTLPEVPITTIIEVEKIVRNSIELYYEMNTIRGCTKQTAPQFSFAANFEDGSCNKKPLDLNFGGVYQTCEVIGQYLAKNPCDGLNQVNPKTGKHACPDSYKAVMIQSAVKEGILEYDQHCYACFWNSRCCDEKKWYLADAFYSTYWCAPTGPVSQESGYLFGGMHRPTQDNPVTGNKGCPSSYYPRNILSDVIICLSDDFENGASSSVPFGGFFSCKSGNPLAAATSHRDLNLFGATHKGPNSLKMFMAKHQDPLTSYPMKCPEGYSQHLATVDDGCSVNYCVKTGSLSAPILPPIKRPPFMLKPMTPLDSDDNYVIFNKLNQTWMKIEKATLFLKKRDDSTHDEIYH